MQFTHSIIKWIKNGYIKRRIACHYLIYMSLKREGVLLLSAITHNTSVYRWTLKILCCCVRDSPGLRLPKLYYAMLRLVVMSKMQL